MSQQQEVDNRKRVFKTHQAKCERCQRYQGFTRDLIHLCWEGTMKFKALLDAEEGKTVKRIKHH